MMEILHCCVPDPGSHTEKFELFFWDGQFVMHLSFLIRILYTGFHADA